MNNETNPFGDYVTVGQNTIAIDLRSDITDEDVIAPDSVFTPAIVAAGPYCYYCYYCYCVLRGEIIKG